MITNDMIINYPFEYIDEQMKTEMDNTDLNEMFDTYCKYSIEISGKYEWFDNVYLPLLLIMIDKHYNNNEDCIFDCLKKCATAIKKCQGLESNDGAYYTIARSIESSVKHWDFKYYSNGKSDCKNRIQYINDIEFDFILRKAKKIETILKNENISNETNRLKSMNKNELKQYVNDKINEIQELQSLIESKNEMIYRSNILLNEM